CRRRRAPAGPARPAPPGPPAAGWARRAATGAGCARPAAAIRPSAARGPAGACATAPAARPRPRPARPRPAARPGGTCARGVGFRAYVPPGVVRPARVRMQRGTPPPGRSHGVGGLVAVEGAGEQGLDPVLDRLPVGAFRELHADAGDAVALGAGRR